MKRLFIVGAGGHAKVVLDAAILMHQWDEIVFFDDRYPEIREFCSFKVLGKIAEVINFYQSNCEVIVAIGDNVLREKLLLEYKQSNLLIASILHPNASISASANIAEGSVVFAGAVVNAASKIGFGSIVNSAAVIEHDCVLGNFVHVSPHATLAGGVSVGKCTWIGMGANIIENVKIGEHVIVGAGSVVLSDVLDRSKVVGVPARSLIDEKK